MGLPPSLPALPRRHSLWSAPYPSFNMYYVVHTFHVSFIFFSAESDFSYQHCTDFGDQVTRKFYSRGRLGQYQVSICCKNLTGPGNRVGDLFYLWSHASLKLNHKFEIAWFWYTIRYIWNSRTYSQKIIRFENRKDIWEAGPFFCHFWKVIKK